MLSWMIKFSGPSPSCCECHPFIMSLYHKLYLLLDYCCEYHEPSEREKKLNEYAKKVSMMTPEMMALFKKFLEDNKANDPTFHEDMEEQG